MGKMRIIKGKSCRRHNPLYRQILEERYASQNSFRKKVYRKPCQLQEVEFVGHTQAMKILNQAKEQQKICEYDDKPKEIFCEHNEKVEELNTEIAESESHSPTPSEYEDDLEIPIQRSKRAPISNRDDVEIPMDEDNAIKKFMIKDDATSKKHYELISEKLSRDLKEKLKEVLAEKKSEIDVVGIAIGDGLSVCNEVDIETLNRFKQLVPVLRDYRTGKLPKAFKAIPRFCNWEQIMLATEPEQWSSATMYEATRVFSSNLEDKMAQRFYNLVLLPRVRDAIAESKKLNDHLYQALKKSLFKPTAFFKGIVIPLCKAGNCTYREATIIGSIIAQFSVPVLHSSAALMTIAAMEFRGVESIFMRILLEKKYCLPLRVLESVMNYFVRSLSDVSKEYSLLWHQCLLTFVQIYNSSLNLEQKEDLLKVIAVHNHKHVTPEIRKILMHSCGLKLGPKCLYKLN